MCPVFLTLTQARDIFLCLSPSKFLNVGNFKPFSFDAVKCVPFFFTQTQTNGKESPGLVVDWSQFSQDLPEIADLSVGINGALFLDPNRG